jgi:hypothetical protein
MDDGLAAAQAEQMEFSVIYHIVAMFAGTVAPGMLS